MKILHLCLGAFFPDHYSYQENLLPKFHRELGYDVEVIASQEAFDKNGNRCYLSQSGYYFNEYGIRVHRLNYSFPQKLNHKLKHYKRVYQAICEISPDIIFIHNCQFLSIFSVIKYLKNRKIKVYVDNHCDYSNSAGNWISKNILHKILWKYCAQKINPYVTKFYGVLPARVDFLTDLYKLPKEKCELLVMGADDEKVAAAFRTNARTKIREKYHIAPNDFLIMTGGKIDAWKTQTLLLMKAVAKIDCPNIKLIVFGSVVPELMDQVQALCVNDKVQYIGWIDAADSCDYFSAADLVVFPGRHSVFWEEVAGMGIPMLCKYWEGTTHVDLGGNVEFLYRDSADEIQTKIEELLNNPEKYEAMQIAAKKGAKYFSYKDIAERCVRDGEKEH